MLYTDTGLTTTFIATSTPGFVRYYNAADGYYSAQMNVSGNMSGQAAC